MRAAAGLKVPHSPRVCCQLSAQRPLSSGSWQVHGLHFARVLRRGSISEEVSGLRFAVSSKGMGQVSSPSCRAHLSALTVVAHPAITVPQNRGDVLGETARLCGRRNLKRVFLTLAPLTPFCCVQTYGTILLDGQGSFKCIPRRGKKRKSQGKPSLGLTEQVGSHSSGPGGSLQFSTLNLREASPNARSESTRTRQSHENHKQFWLFTQH